jgi:hypothetical protein
MTGPSDIAYSDEERRHMWVWGAAIAVSVVLMSVAYFTGHALAGALLTGLGAGFGHRFGEPWRTRHERRLQERGLLRAAENHGE